jgi:hypothetical protein
MTSSTSSQPKSPDLNRRDFLKLMVSTTISGLIPPRLKHYQPYIAEWPSLRVGQLPAPITEILQLVPDTIVHPDGLLAMISRDTGKYINVHLEPTNWNIDNSHPWNELNSDVSWGIVLHWFGDRYPEQREIQFYLRGFNGIRQVGEYYINTSAHFLIGDHKPIADSTQNEVGILQTQKPGPGGVPYEAAHIRSLDYNAYREGRHYFLLALNELNKKYPQVRSILQDFFDQPGVYPHMRTIGVEITGYGFDNPEIYPGSQKIANVVSVVWALMKRYNIPVHNIIGHLEIQLSKPDPGKKFLALIKYLIGIKALIEPEEKMQLLIFGQHLDGQNSPTQAVLAYFDYLRDYLMLTATPRHVSEWDAWSKFFLTRDLIYQGRSELSNVEAFYRPVIKPSWQPGYRFIVPENHEGVDIYPDQREFPKHNHTHNIHLMATGKCIYLGRSEGLHDGQLSIFRHRQVDGSEIISSYGHLNALANLKVGEKYTGGQIIGHITTPKNPPHGFLHFSLAYGPSWDIYLKNSPNIPLNVGPTWIKNYFFNPSGFFTDNTLVPGDIVKNFRYFPL